MPGFTAHMPGFTAQRSLDRTTHAYHDGLRAIPPDGVLRPAQLRVLDEIRLGGHLNFCLNPKCYCALWDPVYIEKCLWINCYCP